MEEDIGSWTTLVPDAGFVKQGEQSGAWFNTLNDINVRNRDVPSDWSDYEYLCFWVHSQVANDAILSVVVESENPETDRDDFWRATVRVGWQGWRQIAMPLGGMRASGSPLGLHQVTMLRFASRWADQEPKPDTELRIDDVRLTTSAPDGAMPDPGVIDDFDGPVRLWSSGDRGASGLPGHAVSRQIRMD